MSVIPILVDGVKTLSPDNLPKGRRFPFSRKGLNELALLKWLAVRSDDDGFETDMSKVITEIRAIIAPGTAPRKRATVTPVEQDNASGSLRAQVRADLLPGGVLNKRLPNYESRPEQVMMAEMMADAIESRHHIVIEAGTGTGKSLAYLLPVVRSRKVTFVSTANKNLQDQLYTKDIPEGIS